MDLRSANPSKHADWLRPCPFRDHHRLFREWVDVHQPEPEDGRRAGLAR